MTVPSIAPCALAAYHTLNNTILKRYIEGEKNMSAKKTKNIDFTQPECRPIRVESIHIDWTRNHRYMPLKADDSIDYGPLHLDTDYTSMRDGMKARMINDDPVIVTRRDGPTEEYDLDAGYHKMAAAIELKLLAVMAMVYPPRPESERYRSALLADVRRPMHWTTRVLAATRVTDDAQELAHFLAVEKPRAVTMKKAFLMLKDADLLNMAADNGMTADEAIAMMGVPKKDREKAWNNWIATGDMSVPGEDVGSNPNNRGRKPGEHLTALQELFPLAGILRKAFPPKNPDDVRRAAGVIRLHNALIRDGEEYDPKIIWIAPADGGPPYKGDVSAAKEGDVLISENAVVLKKSPPDDETARPG